jgi:hypothetical protein
MLPVQETEPVAVIDECDEGKFAELTTEGTWLKIGTKLYTHAPSDKLRQAALAVLEIARENRCVPFALYLDLRAALEGK